MPVPIRRRAFLESASACGAALAGVAVGTGRGRSAQQSPVSFGCSTVSFSQGARNIDNDDAHVVFEDGGYVATGDSYPDQLGSPGRAISGVRLGWPIDDWFENPDPEACGPRATTFDDTSVTVDTAEFSAFNEIPEFAAEVTLYFVDGTAETKTEFGQGGDSSIARTYSGTGTNAGKTIHMIELEHEGFSTGRLIPNPEIAGCPPLEWAGSRVFDIVTTADVELEYQFVVDGRVEKRTDVGEPLRAEENNDTITENGDGTVTVSGFTGNSGFGDSYLVNGVVVSVWQTGGDAERDDYQLLVNGAEPLPSIRAPGLGAAGRNLFQVISTEEGEVSYEFTVDGSVEKREDNGELRRAEGNDTVTDNGDGTVTVSGFTGNEGFGDSYVVVGSLESFDRVAGDADYRLEANGWPVNLTDLL